MRPEKRRYRVEYHDGREEYITGYQNLPEENSVKMIKRIKQQSKPTKKATQRQYWVMYADGSLEKVKGIQNIQELTLQVRRVKFPLKNVAFFDAEYTCPTYADSRPAELLSVGLIICDKELKILERYYSKIRPEFESKLSEYCINLTGLQQEEIDAAPSYEAVMEAVTGLLDSYDVGTVLVWGSDQHILRKDLQANHPQISTELEVKCKHMISNILDIGDEFSSLFRMDANKLSLAAMKYICGMECSVRHNAIDDAADLWSVVCSVKEGKCIPERIREIWGYLEAKERYHRYRRFTEHDFKDAGNSLDISDVRLMHEYVMELDKYKIPEAMAVRDDILVLHGEVAIGFPSMEKYRELLENK